MFCARSLLEWRVLFAFIAEIRYLAQKMAFSKSSNFQEASLNFLMPHPVKYKLAWSSLGGQGTPMKKKTGEGAEADL